MIHVKPKINIRVSLTKEQIAFIRSELKGSRLVYKALTYADLHYNTLYKRALKGEPIKKDQRDKLLAFCEYIKKEKSAAA